MPKVSTDLIFGLITLNALFSGQPFMMLLVISMWFAWEDSKWPAFDSDDFDVKMQRGPLMPWNRGN